MATISQKELQKLASISHIALEQHELESLALQIDTVLTYAQRVQKVSDKQTTFQSHKAVNVFRADNARASCAELILAQAPHEQEGYFVVPRILENN